MIKVLGLDADDTLWQNEEYFRAAQIAFQEILSPFCTADDLHDALTATEIRNIPKYGYGIRGFTLSTIETALQISQCTINPKDIEKILSIGREMLDHPVELLPGVAESLPKLAIKYRIVLVTKGDLLHQQQKIDRSGLASFFDETHIVSEKDVETYKAIFGARITETVMVGNSLKSDIQPALQAGAAAVHIPARYEWDLERAKVDFDNSNAVQAKAFADLVEVLPKIR